MTFPSKLEIRASNAHRVVACPLSAHLSAQLPKPPTSFYAQEGIDAHNLAASMLNALSAGEGIDYDCDPAITEYIDYILRRCDIMKATGIAIEQTLSSPSDLLNDSTPDCILFSETECEVVDLKFGQNVVVGADAWQLRVYAMLALHHYPKYNEVRVTIVQPRHYSYKGAISRIWTREELRQYKEELLNAASFAYNDDPPTTIGEHCQFCPALAVCPTQWKNLETTLNEIKELEKMKPEEITPDKLRHAWIKLENIRKSKFPDEIKQELLKVLDKHKGRYKNLSIKNNSRSSWADGAYDKIVKLAKKYKVPIKNITQPQLLKMSEMEKVFPQEGEKAQEAQKALGLLWQPKPIARSIKIEKETK